VTGRADKAVVGVGIDAVQLDRFRAVLARRPGIVERVFTASEAEYATRRRDPTERFAARFAAKEAVLKAMGAGLWDVPLRCVEVERAGSGAPSVRLSGRAVRWAAERGITGFHVSLTHTSATAHAIALAY
jgi:holo-[acyl-carrier protein] synthase